MYSAVSFRQEIKAFSNSTPTHWTQSDKTCRIKVHSHRMRRVAVPHGIACGVSEPYAKAKPLPRWAKMLVGLYVNQMNTKKANERSVLWALICDRFLQVLRVLSHVVYVSTGLRSSDGRHRILEFAWMTDCGFCICQRFTKTILSIYWDGIIFWYENRKHFFFTRVFLTTSRQFSLLLCYTPVPYWLTADSRYFSTSDDHASEAQAWTQHRTHQCLRSDTACWRRWEGSLLRVSEHNHTVCTIQAPALHSWWLTQELDMTQQPGRKFSGITQSATRI